MNPLMQMLGNAMGGSLGNVLGNLMNIPYVKNIALNFLNSKNPNMGNMMQMMNQFKGQSPEALQNFLAQQMQKKGGISKSDVAQMKQQLQQFGVPEQELQMFDNFLQNHSEVFRK